MKFYAFDGDTIKLIGDFPNIAVAMDHEPNGTLWVFSDVGLKDLRRQIDEVTTNFSREKQPQ